MELKVLEDNQKPLLARRELLVEISFDGKTPSRLVVRKQLADSLRLDEELIVIKSIETHFGYRKANVKAHVYHKKKDLEAAEPKHIMKRHLQKGAEKGGKPAEEKREQPKREEEKKAE